MKIDTALYNNKKRHQLEGYFIVDAILSLYGYSVGQNYQLVVIL